MGISIFNRLLKSQVGFSLTEVMIGGGILAGVGLAGAYVFKEQKLSQKRIDHDQMLTTYHMNLQKQLAIKGNCNATLSGFYGGDITANTDLDISICDPDDAQYNVCKNDTDGDVDAGMKKKLAEADMWIDQATGSTNIWQVERIYVAGSTLTNSGRVKLRVQYKKNPELPTPKTVTKEILLNARFESGGFVECYDEKESSVNNLQKDLCDDITKSLSNTGTVVAKWDEKTQTCDTSRNILSDGKLLECPGGKIVHGINSDGTVRCRDTNNGFDTDLLEQDLPTNTCAPGEKLSIVYASTGRLRVICVP